MGGRQIQSRASVGGNLCNASPAADGVPPLLALDAEVELAGPSGTRRLPLASFITGNRRTALGPGELMVAIHVPRPAHDARSAFLKLGARRYLVISIAMAAATLEIDGGRIAVARVAVGACSAVARRLPALEAALIGAPVDPRLGNRIDKAQLAPLSPIDDVRGSAAYRRAPNRHLVAPRPRFAPSRGCLHPERQRRMGWPPSRAGHGPATILASPAPRSAATPATAARLHHVRLDGQQVCACLVAMGQVAAAGSDRRSLATGARGPPRRAQSSGTSPAVRHLHARHADGGAIS